MQLRNLIFLKKSNRVSTKNHFIIFIFSTTPSSARTPPCSTKVSASLTQQWYASVGVAMLSCCCRRTVLTSVLLKSSFLSSTVVSTYNSEPSSIISTDTLKVLSPRLKINTLCSPLRFLASP